MIQHRELTSTDMAWRVLSGSSILAELAEFGKCYHAPCSGFEDQDVATRSQRFMPVTRFNYITGALKKGAGVLVILKNG